jgi:protease-4
MRPSLFVILALLALPGCLPRSVTFHFAPVDQRLEETTVIDEDATARVALIDVRGLIVDGPQDSFLGQGTNLIDDVVARLAKAEKDSQVKAVILRINSPGGSVSASDTIYAEVRRFADRTHKPVVASLAEVAASGGYYIALAADEIVAQPTTITGSIGVIIPTINVSEGLSRIGIVSRSVKSGANKDLANPLEPMRDSQYAVLQHMVDEFYGRFKGLVVERRSATAPDRRVLDTSRIDALTDGRVVTGAEAAAAGLVDREGGVRDAFERAKAMAGLPRAQLVKYHAEDAPKPRTAYALASPIPAGGAGALRPDADSSELNLINIEVGAGALTGLRPCNAYYLWTGGSP